MRFPKWPIVAIDGAACGGKTSLIALVQKRQAELAQQQLYIVEESARKLDSYGVQFKRAINTGDLKRFWQYEGVIQRDTYYREDIVLRSMAIEGCARQLMLIDRGCQNIRSFLPEGLPGDQIYQSLLRRLRLRPLAALDRYAGVINMVTAADGSIEHYKMDDLRKETPEIARYLECRTQEAWLGHEHLWIIPNFTNVFEEKLERGFAALKRIVGVPQPVEIERQYLVKTVPDLKSFPRPFRAVAIEQTYLLKRNDSNPRIRRRYLPEDPTYSTYTYTEKKRLTDLVRDKRESCISEKTYTRLLESERDPRRMTLKKRRLYFVDSHQYWRLDVYDNLNEPLSKLEIELMDPNDPVTVPSFINAEEVTGVTRYQNSELAKAVR